MPKTATSLIVLTWKMVLNLTKNPLQLLFHLDHFTKDNFLEDDASGLFGILDGHGGGEVVKFCVRSLPEVQILFQESLCNEIDFFTRLLTSCMTTMKTIFQSCIN